MPTPNRRSSRNPWKVDVRLPGRGNSNFHGARPVHLIITMIKWILASRLGSPLTTYWSESSEKTGEGVDADLQQKVVPQLNQSVQRYLAHQKLPHP